MCVYWGDRPLCLQKCGNKYSWRLCQEVVGVNRWKRLCLGLAFPTLSLRSASASLSCHLVSSPLSLSSLASQSLFALAFRVCFIFFATTQPPAQPLLHHYSLPLLRSPAPPSFCACILCGHALALMKHVYPQCPLCGCTAAYVFMMMLLSANEARVCFLAACGVSLSMMRLVSADEAFVSESLQTFAHYLMLKMAATHKAVLNHVYIMIFYSLFLHHSLVAYYAT